MISANIPDLDVLVFATDTPSVSFRRGWTHGIAAQIALPVAADRACSGCVQRRRPQRNATARRRFAPAGCCCCRTSACTLHVFLDYLNNYGVRLLTPFDWRWFYGDAVFIVDPWLWLVLGAGVWLARRRHSPAWRRGYALAIAAIYIAAMLTSARVARAEHVDAQWSWNARHASAGAHGWSAADVAMTRDVIVDAGRSLRVGHVLVAVDGSC